jgi:hypothetical protein
MYASMYDDVEMDSFISQPLALEDAKIYLLQEFHKNIPERKFNKIVFFYKQDAELGETPNFEDIIIYEKDSLDQAIKDFMKTH